MALSTVCNYEYNAVTFVLLFRYMVVNVTLMLSVAKMGYSLTLLTAFFILKGCVNGKYIAGGVI